MHSRFFFHVVVVVLTDCVYYTSSAVSREEKQEKDQQHHYIVFQRFTHVCLDVPPFILQVSSDEKELNEEIKPIPQYSSKSSYTTTYTLLCLYIHLICSR
jgi:hypothetical protein